MGKKIMLIGEMWLRDTADILMLESRRDSFREQFDLLCRPVVYLSGLSRLIFSTSPTYVAVRCEVKDFWPINAPVGAIKLVLPDGHAVVRMDTRVLYVISNENQM